MIRLNLALLLCAAPAVAQLPCFDTNLGTNLNLGDEALSAPLPLGFTFAYGGVNYTSVRVCSNGYVVLGTGGGTPDWSPSHYELITNAEPRICPLWLDFNPAAPGSGGVYANAVAAAGGNPAYFSITWDGVYEFGGTTPHTAQVLLIAGGGIQFHHGANLDNCSSDWLVGASPGSGAVLNHVSFNALPIASATNPTIHQHGFGPVPFAGSTMAWTPAGTGFAVSMATGCGARANYGVGCVAAFGSAYEHFQTTRGFDLANTALSGILSGGNYVLAPGLTSFVNPSPSATSLNLGDDTSTSVSLSQSLTYPGGSTAALTVHSNGLVSAGALGGVLYQPTPSDWLDFANATWAVWHDFIPTASNNVLFEEVAGVAIITWDNVVSYDGQNPGVTPSRFQFQFELATGNFHIVFQAMDATSVSAWLGADGYVVGFTPAGASADPGSRDLSATLAGTIPLFANEIAPLTLRADRQATIGTTVNLVATEVPPGTLFGALLWGFQQFNPGLPLAGIGMPGCFQYNEGAASTMSFFPGASITVAFPLPNTPGLVGLHVYAQMATWSPPATPLGAIASNGVDLTIGR